MFPTDEGLDTTSKRVVDIDAGMVMVVTDLHGDWALYRRYRDLFLTLNARGWVDVLVFTGDLIHSDGPPATDRSLDMVLDLLALRDELGSKLIVLLGNHEMPHIYPFVLAKGDHIYTSRFEHALGQHREAVIEFFTRLPFYVRTRAGVVLCHAGAFPQAHDHAAMRQLFTYSHQVLKQRARRRLPEDAASMRATLDQIIEEDYVGLVNDCFAVSGPDDPRYYDYVIAQIAMLDPRFNLLWSALFTTNERQFDASTYAYHVQALLRQLAINGAAQRVLVTGHLSCYEGYTLVADGQQLRIASGKHAKPYAKARYLLFDAGKTITQAQDLLPGIGSVFA